MPSRPTCIRHVSELPDNGGTRWPWRGTDEVLGVRTPISRPLGLVRLGVHLDVLAPGQRSSLPHAERFEEEAVYVLEGRPRAVLDGAAHRLVPGDACVFPPGTGLEHSIENDSDEPVRLLVVGERLDNAYRAADALLAFCGAGDAREADSLFSEDCRYEHVASGRVGEGRDAAAAGLSVAFAGSHPFAMERTGIVPSADRCAVEWALRGPAPAAAVRARGSFVLSLQGEAIRELVHYEVALPEAAGALP